MKRRLAGITWLIMAAFIFLPFFSQCQAQKGKEAKKKNKDTIVVTSNAFKHTSTIPEKYTCDGEDISPPLSWSGIPDSTKSIALICDDPDAPMGTFVHWVIFNIPPEFEGLDANVPKAAVLKSGVAQGKNSTGRFGYMGPCPPRGKPHRYFFKVYALDKKLELKPGIDKKKLLRAMKGHVLARGELMGYYGRKK